MTDLLHIAWEDIETLIKWHDEFCKPENRDKIIIPNCIYSYHEIYRELVRRENIEQDKQEDIK